MYVPDRYKNPNREEIISFISQNRFGILVTHDGNKPVATHIPIMYHQHNVKLFLHGHISKENFQTETFQSTNDVLVIFHGPHSYVSSSWYSHENVSTWNYIAVHCYGKLKVLSELELVESLINLTNHFESGEKKPKYFENISPEVIRENLTGIVGFSIEVKDMQATYKLSQNRDSHDYNSVIEHLTQRGDASSNEIAKEMLKRKSN